MSQTANVPHSPAPFGTWWMKALLWGASLLVASIVTGLVTASFDHQKMIETQVNAQKISEISEFLKATDDFYPLTGGFVESIHKSHAQSWPERDALISNLNKQISTLQMTAGYLDPNDRNFASTYQTDMVSLMEVARSTSSPIDSKPFVEQLAKVVVERCDMIVKIRSVAGLSPATIDPSCSPPSHP